MRAKSIDINSLVRENVAKLKPYSSARDEFTDFDEGMVFLDANENPFKNDLNRYPDPYQNKLKKNFSDLKNIPLENILLGNGSDEVLDLIFRAFCEPKEDNIITMPPTYGMYKVLSEINDIENNEVLLNSDYQIDVDNVLTVVDKNSKLIFICSPNNPTGNLMAEVSIKQILENFAGLVVIDEAYIDFAEARSWIGEIENYPNLIVTQTMSKAFGMAGIRMGICYANAEIIQVLNKIKPPYNVNQLTQEKAFEILKKIDSVETRIEDIKQNKKILIKELLKIDFIKKVIPSDANFVLIRVDDANKRYNELINRGIVVRNRTNQPLCENTLRISVGTQIEIEQLIAEINKLQ